MTHLVDVSYKISGDELNRRNGSIAMNAVLSSLRGLGRDQMPLLDRDYQIFSMIHASLNGLYVNSEEYTKENPSHMVAPLQSKRNPALDKIDHGIERALGLLADEEYEPVKASSKKAAA